MGIHTYMCLCSNVLIANRPLSTYSPAGDIRISTKAYVNINPQSDERRTKQQPNQHHQELQV